MNKKAEKFEKMLKENKIECFQKEEIKDELHTVLFRSFMEIEGLQLPVVVILDDQLRRPVGDLLLIHAEHLFRELFYIVSPQKTSCIYQ